MFFGSPGQSQLNVNDRVNDGVDAPFLKLILFFGVALPMIFNCLPIIKCIALVIAQSSDWFFKSILNNNYTFDIGIRPIKIYQNEKVSKILLLIVYCNLYHRAFNEMFCAKGYFGW